MTAWLWFLDGACLDWLERRALDRDTLCDLLLGTLYGAVSVAGGVLPLTPIACLPIPRGSPQRTGSTD